MRLSSALFAIWVSLCPFCTHVRPPQHQGPRRRLQELRATRGLLKRIRVWSWKSFVRFRDFPKELTDFEYSHCHIPAFPDAIAAWGYLETLSVEYSNITQLQSALMDLQVLQLMVGYNLIEQVPDTLLANQAMAILYLYGNPLQALPATIGSFASADYLVFEGTNVTQVPDWFEAYVAYVRKNVADYVVSAYCDRVLAAFASDPTSLTAFEQSLVTDVCFETHRTTGFFPIALVDPQRTPALLV